MALRATVTDPGCSLDGEKTSTLAAHTNMRRGEVVVGSYGHVEWMLTAVAGKPGEELLRSWRRLLRGSARGRS
jgi:hypothetical protein